MSEYEICSNCFGNKLAKQNCNCMIEDLSDFDCGDGTIEKPYNSDDRSEAEKNWDESEKYVDPKDITESLNEQEMYWMEKCGCKNEDECHEKAQKYHDLGYN